MHVDIHVVHVSTCKPAITLKNKLMIIVWYVFIIKVMISSTKSITCYHWQHRGLWMCCCTIDTYRDRGVVYHLFSCFKINCNSAIQCVPNSPITMGKRDTTHLQWVIQSHNSSTCEWTVRCIHSSITDGLSKVHHWVYHHGYSVCISSKA